MNEFDKIVEDYINSGIICSGECPYLFINFANDGYCDKFSCELQWFTDIYKYKCKKCLKENII